MTDEQRFDRLERIVKLMENGMALGSRRVSRDEIYEERARKWLGSTPTS